MLTGNATARPPRIAWHIPPILSAKEMHEGREKKKTGALDRPLVMSRGSGVTLALRSRPQIHTPHKVKTLEAYPILPRPRGLHSAGALARTPRKKAVQKQVEAPTTTWLKPGKEQTRRIASGGVSLLLHSLGGYCRVP
jgi:hypothetical protein